MPPVSTPAPSTSTPTQPPPTPTQSTVIVDTVDTSDVGSRNRASSSRPRPSYINQSLSDWREQEDESSPEVVSASLPSVSEAGTWRAVARHHTPAEKSNTKDKKLKGKDVRMALPMPKVLRRYLRRHAMWIGVSVLEFLRLWELVEGNPESFLENVAGMGVEYNFIEQIEEFLTAHLYESSD